MQGAHETHEIFAHDHVGHIPAATPEGCKGCTVFCKLKNLKFVFGV